MGYLIGPSGGLAYHMAAWLGRKRRWRPFIDSVDRWLCDQWHPRERDLIIFGPSAGWTLSERFLKRFDSILCVEPDPLARLMFRRRFGALTRLHFESRTDLLPWFAPPSSRNFEFFIHDHRDHAILFSNLLGQIPVLRARHRPCLEMEDEGMDFASDSDARNAFFTTLSGRSWASYHDVLSGDQGPIAIAPHSIAPSKDTSQEDLLAKLATSLYPPVTNVLDHETLWLSRNHETEFAFWELRPEAHHLIGFIHS